MCPNFLVYTLRPEVLHFALLHFLLKKLLHFASKVATIWDNVACCVKRYILR